MTYLQNIDFLIKCGLISESFFILQNSAKSLSWTFQPKLREEVQDSDLAHFLSKKPKWKGSDIKAFLSVSILETSFLLFARKCLFK